MTEGRGGAGLEEGMAILLRDCPLTEWREKAVTRRPTWAHARKDDLRGGELPVTGGI